MESEHFHVNGDVSLTVELDSVPNSRELHKLLQSCSHRNRKTEPKPRFIQMETGGRTVRLFIRDHMPLTPFNSWLLKLPMDAALPRGKFFKELRGYSRGSIGIDLSKD